MAWSEEARKKAREAIKRKAEQKLKSEAKKEVNSAKRKIKKEVKIKLTMEDGRVPSKPSEGRSAREFASYYQKIWKELMDYADEV